MPSLRKTQSGTFQLCVKNNPLPQPLWATFDSCEQAKQYDALLERLLGQRIVPAALLENEPPKRSG